jgi:hypothetical protein
LRGPWSCCKANVGSSLRRRARRVPPGNGTRTSEGTKGATEMASWLDAISSTTSGRANAPEANHSARTLAYVPAAVAGRPGIGRDDDLARRLHAPQGLEMGAGQLDGERTPPRCASRDARVPSVAQVDDVVFAFPEVVHVEVGIRRHQGPGNRDQEQPVDRHRELVWQSPRSNVDATREKLHASLGPSPGAEVEELSL